MEIGFYKEKALLVGVNENDNSNFSHSMEELAQLAEACNMEVCGQVTQNLPMINNALYLGTGKLEEVKEMAADLDVDMVLFDNALSPTQLRNLKEYLDYPIWDRTALILNIFEKRAHTSEACMQVELAKLEYMLPRLIGMRDSLGRQGGTSGSMSNRGAGEKKLELDRRHIEHQISMLKKNLVEVKKDRETQRKRRSSSHLPLISLVGYTNAGKSTLMNALLTYCEQDEEKKVLEKDMLFATLDTTVRKITPPGGRSFLLSDTVGFIDKLPHNLIQAFRSTLEEVSLADALLQVVDYSDPHCKEQMQVTEDTLKELGAQNIPMITIFNKADLVLDPGSLPQIKKDKMDATGQSHSIRIYISAKEGIGLTELTDQIFAVLSGGNETMTLLLPYTEGSILPLLMDQGTVTATEYLPEGTKVTVTAKAALLEKYKEYRLSSDGENPA
ncbi:MAG: GTPase HflX [Lachnospiraceae bacterium]|nr:GTPase HflX [Lachnospiraceae bacterium]